MSKRELKDLKRWQVRLTPKPRAMTPEQEYAAALRVAERAEAGTWGGLGKQRQRAFDLGLTKVPPKRPRKVPEGLESVWASVADVVNNSPPDTEGARLKRFEGGGVLAPDAAWAAFQGYARAKMCTATRTDSTVRVEFNCQKNVLAASGKASAYFTRFDAAAAGPLQRQPRVTLLCTKAYRLVLVWRRTVTLEYLTSADDIQTACFCDDCNPTSATAAPKTMTLKPPRGKGRPPRAPKTAQPCSVGGPKCSKTTALFCSTSNKAWCRYHWSRDRVATDHGRTTRAVSRDVFVVTVAHFDPHVMTVAHANLHPSRAKGKQKAVEPAPLPPPTSTPADDAAPPLAAVPAHAHGAGTLEQACALCPAPRQGRAHPYTLYDAFEQRWLCTRCFDGLDE